MKEAKQEMREKMPNTAAIVDAFRAAYGAEWVNAALQAGGRAQREHSRLVREHGQVHADRWLAAQRFPQGCFWAQEGEHVVGVRRA